MKSNTHTTKTNIFSKLVFACFSVLLLSTTVIAQNIQWAKTTTTNYASVNDIITDAAGNTYILGDFSGTVNFGNSFSLTSNGSFDGYLCKRDAAGTVLWATKIATGMNEERVRGMAMSGNYLYVGGDFSSNPVTCGSTSFSSSGGRDMLLIRVDATYGWVDWAKRNGGTGDEYVNDIVVSADGNSVYFTGEFWGVTNFGGSFTSNGFSDTYVARITYNGFFGSFARFGGTGGDIGNGITIDAADNIYITGSIGAQNTFGTYTLTPSGGDDIFIAKLPASNFNNVIWANNYGSSGNDFGYDITLDAAGSVYTTGSFNGFASFGAQSVSSAGGNDMYVVKMNPSGVTQWAKSGGGAADDVGNKIAVTTATDVIVTGTMRNPATFGGIAVGNNGLNDIFVTKLSPAGVYKWALGGGGAGNDFGTAVAANSTAVFAGGGYNIEGYFGNFTLTGSSNHAYLLKIDLCTATTKTVTATACASYAANSQTYTATGVYTQTLTNSKGCDSLLTLNLTIKQPTSNSITQTACGSYAANSQTYTTSGVYTQTLVNSKGCDSLLTLNLTINQPTSRSITQTACGSYAANSHTYTTSGVYTQTLTNSKGCDSLLTLNLTINQPTSRSLTQVACVSYALNSQTYTISGAYTQTLTNSKGCDSLLTLNLTINQPTSRSITQTACSSYAANSHTYTTSGVYTQTLTNSKGCDSLLTINLTINQPTSRSITQTVCGSYSANSHTYTTSGVYTQTLTNSKGCDSLLTLNLTINQPTSRSLTQVACDSYVLNAQTYTLSGVYTQTLTNSKGCDSLLTLNLTVNHPTSRSITQTACGSYAANSQTYTATGIYTQTLTNSKGCDSLLTINLTINQPSTGSITQTACGSYAANSQTYTSTGVYTQTLTNAVGCDSILTLNLTIRQVTGSTHTETACDSYTLNAQVYTLSGTYTQTLTNSVACDSIITLNLTINTVNNSVTQNGLVLTATETGGAYQWLDCDNGNQPIPGANAQTYTVTANGNYAVSIIKNGCSKVSTCANISTVGMAENTRNVLFSVYPNPSNGVVTITANQLLEKATLKVYTVTGQLVKVYAGLKGEQMNMDISDYNNGMYLIELEQNGSVYRTRIVKN